MIELTAHELAEIIEGKYFGTPNLKVSGEVIFDSRAATPGSIFAALAGEAQDGHEFIEDAIRNGAILALVARPVSGNHILVKDVLVALSKLAREVRRRLINLKVVGITGSQGKTTTKDMLQSILSSVGKSIAPIGSYNNDIGVPITLLRCDESTNFCILEMGARHEGDIARLTEIAAPNVGVVLRVGTAHLGEFGSREIIARTKGELIRGLESKAVAVLGTYDEFTPHLADSLQLKTFTFGEVATAKIRAADVEIRGGFPAFDLVTPEGRERVELQVLGEHQISNALAAAAAAVALGVSTPEIAAALSTHESSSKWRMELHELGEITLINDSYNANPESMAAALKTLVLLTQERGGNSWAFLGKMHELGPDSPRMHEEIGRLVGELGIDHLVSIADCGYIKGATGSSTSIHDFPDPESCQVMIQEFQPGDVVLVKASRAEHLELIAEQIVNEWSNRGEN